MLVGLGVGGEGVEEVLLKILWEAAYLGIAEGLAAGGCRDDGEELEIGEGGSGDVDALGVGADVRWGEVEAEVVDEVVEQDLVGGGETFDLVSGAEGEPDPEAFGAGPGEEGTAGEALGVDGVGQIEVPHVADEFDIREGNGENATGEVQEMDGAMGDKGGDREISGQDIAKEAADDDLLMRG
jgi:hypothetical protein